MGIFSRNKNDARLIVHNDVAKIPFAKFANLPPVYKKPDKKIIDADGCRKALSQFNNSSIRMLEEAKNILATTNALTIKPELRFDIVNTIFSHVYPEFAMWYYKYQNMESSLPESRERRTTLISCIDVLEQMAVAYELYFKELYSVTPGKFKKVREKLSIAGFRIMEILMLLQRMYALRYQKLPRTDWHNCNQVFFSMALHNATDNIYQLHGSIGVRDQTSKDARKNLYKSSIQKLFLSIHLFGLMDVCTWPIRLFHVPDAYLEFLEGTGLKIAPDHGETLQPGWLYVDLNQDGPFRGKRVTSKQAPAVLVDYTILYNTLVKDRKEISKMKFISDFDVKKLSRPLQKFDDEYQVPVLDLMLMAFQHRDRKYKRYSSFADEALKVYFGKKDVLQLLVDLSSSDVDNVMRSRRFIDTLASQSSLLSFDDSLHMRSNWQIINFSTGGMLLQTAETSFNNPIQLGQLVAVLPGSANRKPTLGVVVRLQRHKDGLVEIAIQTLANHAEVAFVFEQRTEDATGKGVIIFQGVNGLWYIVLNPVDNNVSGTPYWLVRPKTDRVPMRLGDVYMSKKEFVIFEVRSPGMK